jgi:hypothetical protein
MALRDLGYKSYEGTRLPPSSNFWVIFRHGMRRGMRSWLVWVAVFFFWLPPLLALIIDSIVGQVRGQPTTSGEYLKLCIDTSFWLLIAFVSTGTGATLIAHDRLHRSFQFYFAKPVTPLQYLAGRATAVALWNFLILFVPAFLVNLLQLAGTGMGGMMGGPSVDAITDSRTWEVAGLVLPSFAYALLISVVVSAVSIGISAISKSRGLTSTTWLTILLLPTLLAMMVAQVGDWPWLWLTSIWGLCDVIGDGLFKINLESDGGLEWYYALPVIVLASAGAIYGAYQRVRRAEVIT